MIFAFTGSAIMIGLGIASCISMAAGTAISAYSAYEQGKEQKRQAEFAAQEAEKQAQLNEKRAGIEQLRSERETENRSLAMAQEIGSAYANFAGNGLLVDGGGSNGVDTLGHILNSSARTAAADISTIQDNSSVNIWTLNENSAQLRRSAANYIAQGDAAYKGGILNAAGTAFSGAGRTGASAYGMFA